MRVMRDNRYSVMAMLEAFVYDPLISWRLLAKHTNTEAPTTISISRVNSGVEQAGGGQQRSPAVLIPGPGTGMIMPDISADHVLTNDAAEILGMDMERSPRRAASLAVGTMRDVLHRGLTHELSRTMSQEMMMGDDEPMQENLNARALEVINRIQAKLTGRDFARDEEGEDLTVAEQVDRLIKEATSVENLCQLFNGWCPLW
jgi:FKBP12-rapamycin complex-associated protein